MAHDHQHSHAIQLNRSNRRAFVAGIVLNLGFVLAELIIGLIHNSMALLTDAGHNAGDVASLVLSLVALWMVHKRSSAEFTYGYKKTTILAALANAVILLIAIGILGFESYSRLLKPEKVDGGVIAWVAGAGILVNGLSAFLFYRHQGRELNARGAYLHLLADAMVSMAVVVAGLVMKFTGWYWLDAAVGLLIVVVILISTWNLLRQSFKMSIDAVPEGIELEQVKKVICDVPSVKNVAHVHVWSLSTTENALTAQVVLDESLNFDDKLATLQRIKHELEHYNIHHSTLELIRE